MKKIRVWCEEYLPALLWILVVQIAMNPFIVFMGLCAIIFINGIGNAAILGSILFVCVWTWMWSVLRYLFADLDDKAHSYWRK